MTSLQESFGFERMRLPMAAHQVGHREPLRDLKSTAREPFGSTTSATGAPEPPATFEATAARGYARHHPGMNAGTHVFSHRCDVRNQAAVTAGSEAAD